MSEEFGYCEGDTCKREGCSGTIGMHRSDNCSCHLSAPCSSCTAPRSFCGACGWEEADDPAPVYEYTPNSHVPYMPRPLDPTKIDWRNASHTHFSMVKEGVYPEGTTRAEVEKLVQGTFGGRFEYFGHGKFKYIAYTD